MLNDSLDFIDSMNITNLRDMDDSLLLFNNNSDNSFTNEELIKILNPQQFEAVTHPSNLPISVYAGPGSGKTKVITYRIAYLIKHYNLKPENIFAMTFTNKAANEMKHRIISLLNNNNNNTSTLTSSNEQHNPLDFCYMGTFHSICAKILRKHANYLSGLDRNYNILDDTDQKQLLLNICKQSGNLKIRKYFGKKDVEKKLSPMVISQAISKAKNNQQTAKDFKDSLEISFPKNSYNINNSFKEQQEVIAEIFMEYEILLKDNKLLDFDDLLLKVVILFETSKKVRDYYSERCHALLIDEFQDVNTLQYKISKYLCEKRRNIFVVGDVDQNIYSWRNSNVTIMQTIMEEFPNIKTVSLFKNYRSTQNILTISNMIIEENTNRLKRSLQSENNMGLPVCIKENDDGEAEATFVATEILKLIKQSNSTLNFSDFAVLVRINAASRSFENTFVSYGIKYKVIGCYKFYDRMEVKDILGYARLLVNPNDNISFNRIINVPKRGIGEKSLKDIETKSKELGISNYELLRQICLEKRSVSGITVRKGLKEFVNTIEDLKKLNFYEQPKTLLTAIINKINYKEYLQNYDKSSFDTRWENITELINVCAEFELKEKVVATTMEKNNEDTEHKETLVSKFLHNIALVPDNFNEGESDENNNNLVTISTIHSAKGLEFGIVFVAGVEEGTLPFYRAEKPSEIEEERRLLFVACTRAKGLLYLTSADTRFKFGENKSCSKSHFLNPLYRHLHQSDKKNRNRNNNRNNNNNQQQSILVVDRISNILSSKFGNYEKEWIQTFKVLGKCYDPTKQLPQLSYSQDMKTPTSATSSSSYFSGMTYQSSYNSSSSSNIGSSLDNVICIDSDDDEVECIGEVNNTISPSKRKFVSSIDFPSQSKYKTRKN
ncbi:hypothetical protein ABK040_009601 [Willaertia magna]